MHIGWSIELGRFSCMSTRAFLWRPWQVELHVGATPLDWISEIKENY
jgi:hypothetical protein